MDPLLIVLVVATLGSLVLAFEELCGEGKLLDSAADKLRNAIGRASRK